MTKASRRKKIEIIYAGGTISSLTTSQGYREGGHVMDLMGIFEKKMPYLKSMVFIGTPIVAFTGLSENIIQKNWKKMEQCVLRCIEKHPDGILITHGTDSMEQTAKYLDARLRPLLLSKHIPLVLTGANEDITHPKTDAWNNIFFALKRIKQYSGPGGVYVAFHNRFIPADFIVKEPFNGFEMNYISKNDGKYNKKIQVRKRKDDACIARFEKKCIEKIVIPDDAVYEYAVNIVRENHDELFSYLKSHSVAVILLVLYHSGTANTKDKTASVARLVQYLRKTKHILFFGVTENGEPVDLHSYETSVALREAGVVPLYTMSGNLARVKLHYRNKRASQREFIQFMLTDIAGEIDEKKIIQRDKEALLKLYSDKI